MLGKCRRPCPEGTWRENRWRRPLILHAENGAVPTAYTFEAKLEAWGIRSPIPSRRVKAIGVRPRGMPRGDAALHAGEEHPRQAPAEGFPIDARQSPPSVMTKRYVIAKIGKVE